MCVCGGGDVCACMYGWDHVCVWFVVTYIPFFSSLCFVFPKGVTAFTGLITPGSLVCNRLSEPCFIFYFFK